MEIKQNEKSSACLLKFLVAMNRPIQALIFLIIKQHCFSFTVGVNFENKGKYSVISGSLIAIILQHATTIKAIYVQFMLFVYVNFSL